MKLQRVGDEVLEHAVQTRAAGLEHWQRPDLDAARDALDLGRERSEDIANQLLAVNAVAARVVSAGPRVFEDAVDEAAPSLGAVYEGSHHLLLRGSERVAPAQQPCHQLDGDQRFAQ